jgi:hypothetical protein
VKSNRIKDMFTQIASCVGINSIESVHTRSGKVIVPSGKRDLDKIESKERIDSMMAIVNEDVAPEVRHNLESMGYKPLSIHDSNRGVVLVFNQESKI